MSDLQLKCYTDLQDIEEKSKEIYKAQKSRYNEREDIFEREFDHYIDVVRKMVKDHIKTLYGTEKAFFNKITHQRGYSENARFTKKKGKTVSRRYSEKPMPKMPSDTNGEFRKKLLSRLQEMGQIVLNRKGMPNTRDPDVKYILKKYQDQVTLTREGMMRSRYTVLKWNNFQPKAE